MVFTPTPCIPPPTICLFCLFFLSSFSLQSLALETHRGLAAISKSADLLEFVTFPDDDVVRAAQAAERARASTGSSSRGGEGGGYSSAAPNVPDGGLHMSLVLERRPEIGVRPRDEVGVGLQGSRCAGCACHITVKRVGRAVRYVQEHSWLYMLID